VGPPWGQGHFAHDRRGGPHHPELAKEIVARGRDPQMVRVWNAFLHYAKSRPGVAFLRKDEIARFGLQSPLTLRESETI
jgi:hypothetical protein